MVLLPGRRDAPGTFQSKGFLKVAQRDGLQGEVFAADAHLGYYLNGTLVARLKEDIVEPAQKGGAREVWLVGISMGGLGALLYAQRHPQDLAGVVVFAPYLGARDLTGEIRAAGGILAWNPDRSSAGEPYQRELWAWLRANAARGEKGPPIYLGYGADDPFAPACALMGGVLPKERVFVEPGGHSWSTWRQLWSDVLRHSPLTRAVG